jgi:UDP-N-acetylmuramate dehydrogenase
MAYVVQENIPLALYSTFRMGGTARYFIELTDEKDITEVAVFAKKKQVPVVILGGGSTLYLQVRNLTLLF